MELVAKIYANGAAVFGDRAGVEFHDVGGRWLVFPDGLRDVRVGESRFAPSRPRFLFANGRQCGRHASHRLGTWGDDRNHRADRSADLAAGDCMDGKIQIRASGIGGGTAFFRFGPAEALQSFAVPGASIGDTGARVLEFIFRQKAGGVGR